MRGELLQVLCLKKLFREDSNCSIELIVQVLERIPTHLLTIDVLSLLGPWRLREIDIHIETSRYPQKLVWLSELSARVWKQYQTPEDKSSWRTFYQTEQSNSGIYWTKQLQRLKPRTPRFKNTCTLVRTVLEEFRHDGSFNRFFYSMPKLRILSIDSRSLLAFSKCITSFPSLEFVYFNNTQVFEREIIQLHKLLLVRQEKGKCPLVIKIPVAKRIHALRRLIQADLLRGALLRLENISYFSSWFSPTNSQLKILALNDHRIQRTTEFPAKLEHLSLDTADVQATDGFRRIASTLQSLDLSFSTVPNVRELLEGMIHLKFLDLEGVSIDRDQISIVLSFLADQTPIEYLNIGSLVDIELIQPFIKASRTICYLGFDQFDVSEQFLDMIEASETLQGIRIRTAFVENGLRIQSRARLEWIGGIIPFQYDMTLRKI